ncbi:uncharacterized protein L3040_009009 [Drepanopeziza brunnea f. sp. 'multigermtubi']|uniref:Uncharacterized protein n=1 Tax=Marssonina brunnea f. sp. multigermtubi (strain MB_m1) TaxID=1072389 RepID=K1XMB2_MARBU|nr:uncharacterized protein MBM_08317 [Drepanopeziza brunnea f. sp. 'multigermtubi' MB_m1]EKD13599.1 hypothetical protein MBM_08317 [Drepanopeziza brunnea f. sp. 'multigermtubi' MB_m1]KAJ5032404.1 hypothetical protein L3040_009009 [Drepanopeziza brunnea f. sp. 'multigermtubi']
MFSSFNKTAIVLAVLPAVWAFTCTTSGAESWPAGNDFSDAPFAASNSAYGGAQDVAGCASYCQQNQACVTGCLDLILQGQCNAVGGSACDDGLDDGTGTGGTSSNPVDDLIKRSKVRAARRTTLDCASGETCYEYTDESLLCVDLDTGLYHDDVEGNGSLVDGTYTAAGGQVQTGTGTPAGTATGVAVASSSRRTDVASLTPSSASTTTIPARGSAASSGSVASAPVTRASGLVDAASTDSAAVVLQAGGVLGALGLAVGLVL